MSKALLLALLLLAASILLLVCCIPLANFLTDFSRGIPSDAATEITSYISDAKLTRNISASLEKPLGLNDTLSKSFHNHTLENPAGLNDSLSIFLHKQMLENPPGLNNTVPRSFHNQMLELNRSLENPAGLNDSLSRFLHNQMLENSPGLNNTVPRSFHNQMLELNRSLENQPGLNDTLSRFFHNQTFENSTELNVTVSRYSNNQTLDLNTTLENPSRLNDTLPRVFHGHTLESYRQLENSSGLNETLFSFFHNQTLESNTTLENSPGINDSLSRFFHNQMIDLNTSLENSPELNIGLSRIVPNQTLESNTTFEKPPGINNHMLVSNTTLENPSGLSSNLSKYQSTLESSTRFETPPGLNDTLSRFFHNRTVELVDNSLTNVCNCDQKVTDLTTEPNIVSSATPTIILTRKERVATTLETPGLINSRNTSRRNQRSPKNIKKTFSNHHHIKNLRSTIQANPMAGSPHEGDDAAARSERSANLSHITGLSRKIQIFIKNRYLQVSPDGVVNGTSDDDSDHTIMQRTTVHIGQIRIQGVATCLFLCMDSCGLLYGSKEFTEDCIFNEMIEQHHYNTYSSAKYSGRVRTLYLALNKRGEPRKVQIPTTRNLGKLSTYTRALTQTVTLERVEKLAYKLLGPPLTPRPLRHQHGARQLCPSTPLRAAAAKEQDDSGRDRTRCRRRKKRRKKKRLCRDGEEESEDCSKRLETPPPVVKTDSADASNINKRKLGVNKLVKKCEDCAPKKAVKGKKFSDKQFGGVKKRKIKVTKERKKIVLEVSTTVPTPAAVKVIPEDEEDLDFSTTPDSEEDWEDSTATTPIWDDEVNSSALNDEEETK